MTNLQRAYYTHRARGRSHPDAVLAVAQAHALDSDTVRRVLGRIGVHAHTPVPATSHDLPRAWRRRPAGCRVTFFRGGGHARRQGGHELFPGVSTCSPASPSRAQADANQGSRVSAAKSTPQVRALLLAGLRTGLTLAEAGDDVAVAPETVNSRLQRGRRETGTDYSMFAEAVDLARETAATSVMDEDEFKQHLNAAVRKGSVTAMKLWRAIHDADGEDDDSERSCELDELDGDSIIDELAARKRSEREQPERGG